MTKQKSYSYFAIKGDFKTQVVTHLLKIQPTNSWNIGDIRKDGKTKHSFSFWEAGLCDQSPTDLEEQCRITIRELKDKIEILQKIKKEIDGNTRGRFYCVLQ